MLIRFLRDFQGRATNERYYEADTKADLATDLAEQCIAEGAAVAVPLVAREGQAKPAGAAHGPPTKQQRGRRA